MEPSGFAHAGVRAIRGRGALGGGDLRAGQEKTEKNKFPHGLLNPRHVNGWHELDGVVGKCHADALDEMGTRGWGCVQDSPG